jgi:hypothetical protein
VHLTNLDLHIYKRPQILTKWKQVHIYFQFGFTIYYLSVLTQTSKHLSFSLSHKGQLWDNGPKLFNLIFLTKLKLFNQTEKRIWKFELQVANNVRSAFIQGPQTIKQVKWQILLVFDRFLLVTFAYFLNIIHTPLYNEYYIVIIINMPIMESH